MGLNLNMAAPGILIGAVTSSDTIKSEQSLLFMRFAKGEMVGRLSSAHIGATSAKATI